MSIFYALLTWLGIFDILLLNLKLGRQVVSERAKSVFVELSEGEARHLEELASIFEKTL